MENIFFEITLIIIIAVLMGMVMRLLRQPLIIGHILTGIVVSPYFLGLIESTDTLQTFARIGIALLLFMVGLNLNPKIIKEVGKVSLITGLGQIIFTSLFGYLIATMLGFSSLVSIYIAIALTFSSTIIIMKLLWDKGDLETLYGRIATGFLIVQDLVAILVLMFVTSFTTTINLTSFALETVLKGVGSLGVLLLITLYVFPRITKVIARSQEFLLLFSLGWCFAVASLFEYLNFSLEAGALLAGVSLSLSHYRYEIGSRMKPLRDFFIVMFFIILGSQMVFTNFSQFILPIVVFSLFILIGNPLIVMILMGLLGFSRRNSFLAGLTVAQISEFSLILLSLGVAQGHLSKEILSLVTMVGLITITGSTYLILYSERIYPLLSPFLKIFEKKGKKVDEHSYHTEERYDVILFGYNRIGYDILESLKKIHKKFLVVDYNPDTIVKLAQEGFNCKFGDANDLEILNELNLANAKMIISTIPHIETNLLLINKTREMNKKAIITVISHQIDEALKLYDAGATYVLLPHFLGGHHMSTMIEEHKLTASKYIKERILHLKHLKTRKKLGHEHPLR